MKKNYPDYFSHIQSLMNKLGEELPKPMSSFVRLHETSVATGALDTKTKELIALAIAISVRCDGCISFHVHDALAACATRQEIVETIGVAVMMGGGPAAVYGSEALEAVDQFEATQNLCPHQP